MDRRRVDNEELAARIGSGDRSFLAWLRSGDRRDNFLPEQFSGPTSRFLGAYWRKVFADEKGVVVVLDIGVGRGHNAVHLRKSGKTHCRFVGMDYDPECVRRLRRQFGNIPEMQFHNLDYLRPPKIPRPFDYIILSQIYNYLPNYRDLTEHLWRQCTRGMLLAFNKPFAKRTTDYLVLDPQERQLHAEYSLDLFKQFCNETAEICEGVTIFSDGGDRREQLVLFRKDAGVPDLSNVHRFADEGVTFPFYKEGLVSG